LHEGQHLSSHLDVVAVRQRVFVYFNPRISTSALDECSAGTGQIVQYKLAFSQLHLGVLPGDGPIVQDYVVADGVAPDGCRFP
jgi:hypothetical protein